VSSQRIPRYTRALYGTVILTGSFVAGAGNLGVPDLSNSIGVLIDEGPPASTRLNAQPTSDKVDSSSPDEETTAGSMATAGSDDSETVETAMPPSESGPLRMAALEMPEPTRTDREAVNPIGSVDECLVSEVCIDEYLWSLYQRTPKRDSIKVVEQIKIKVIKNGKPRTVAQTITKLVPEDFTWKDPKAAEQGGVVKLVGICCDAISGGVGYRIRQRGQLADR
jgi:hypothetical protein